MPNLQTSKLVPYAWSDLFNLVLDLKSYPEFVPHCRAVRLLSCKSEGPHTTIIVSRMTVGFLAFEVAYTNRAIGDALKRSITVELIDGPLQYLHAVWSFEPWDENHTRLHFSVNYEFSNRLLAAVASRVFDAMFGQILSAFEHRAARVFPTTGTTTGVTRW